MARKRIENPPLAPLSVQEKPAVLPPPKVITEATYKSDAKTQHELIVQLTEIPFMFRGKHEFRELVRIFIRPDESHDEPNEADDDKLPSVLIDPKNMIGDVALDFLYTIGTDDPPKSFKMRAKLEEQIDEANGAAEELDLISDVLSEFDMPGDLPPRLYSLSDRLRSIFRKANGLS